MASKGNDAIVRKLPTRIKPRLGPRPVLALARPRPRLGLCEADLARPVNPTSVQMLE